MFSSKVTRLKSSNSSRPLFWEFHSKKNAKLFSTSQYLRIVGGGTNNIPRNNAQTQTKPRLRDGIKDFIACCKTWIDRCKKTEGPKVLKCQNICIFKNSTYTLHYHQKFTVSEFFIPESIFLWIHLRMDYKKYIPSEEVRNKLDLILIYKLLLMIRLGNMRRTSGGRRRRGVCIPWTRRGSTARPPPPCPRPSLDTRRGRGSPRCTPATPSAGQSQN